MMTKLVITDHRADNDNACDDDAGDNRVVYNNACHDRAGEDR